MNKRLLFLSVSLLMSVAAMAQWELPKPEKFEKLTVEHAEMNSGLAANINTSEEPSTYYYLYNKESGLFFTQGNAYQTQASVGRNPLKVYFVSEIEGDDTELLIKSWSSDRTSMAWRSMFLENGGVCYVDHASTTNYHWYWDDLGDNTYRFYGSAENPDFNLTTYPDCYFGFDLHAGASFTGGCAWNLNISNVPEGHKYCVEWQLVSEEEYAKIADKYNASISGADFMNRMNYAKTLGDINTSRYEPYIASEEITNEQIDSLKTILNASISLKESVNNAAKADPAINLDRFKPFYAGAESTKAEMDSVRGLISPAVALSDYINVIATQYPSIDITDAKALLAKVDWTTEELSKMTNDLKAEARRLDVAVYLEGATEDDPRDGTMLLENPRFDLGNISGWTVTIQGQNIGYQENSGNFTDVTLADGTVVRGYANTDRNGYYSWLWKFIESWHPSNTLPNGTIHQVITGLPSGKYKFSCDAIATYQPDGNRQPQGVYLFAKSGQYEFTEPIFSGNEKPEHFELTFISVNDTITFGLKAQGANTNWLAADNFQITYYGPVADNPYKIALDATIASYEEKYPDMGEIYANSGKKEAYETAMEEAMSASADGSTDDDFLNASNALIAAADSLAASISDYAKIKDAITRCESEQEHFEGTAWEGLGNQFEDLKMIIEDGYNDGNAEEALTEFQLGEDTYSTTIGELSAFMDKMVVDFITNHVKAGDEITILLNNPDFETNFSGWTVTGSRPGWGGLNSSTNGQGPNQIEEYAEMELKGGGNAEVYCNTFDMSQVVYNLPKGSYTLTVQAYERNEDHYLDDWAQGPEVGISAELYCNEFVKKVNNVMVGSQPNQVYSTADPSWASDRNANEMYQPNCMTGANFYFNLGEDRKVYENKVNFVLTEDGAPITIGLRTASKRGWVIFDNFRLYYNGSGKEIYQEIVDGLKADLATVVGTDDEPVNAGSDAKTDAEKQIAALDAVMADNSKDGDDVLAVIAEANETLKYGKESIQLYSDLNTAATNLGTNFDGAAAYITDEVFNEANNLIEGALAVYADGSKDNAGVTELIAQLNEMSTYLSEAVTLRDDLSNAYLNLTEAINTYSSSAAPNVVSDATALSDEVFDKLNAQLDNEEVRTLINKVNAYAGMLAAPDRSELLPADVADATAEAPVNVSSVIENATFDTVGDFHGWLGTGFGAGGTTSTNAEHYNRTYDSYQDIAGLPAGYYVATVQGYYRHGSSGKDWTLYNEEDKSAHNQAYFYATSATEHKETMVQYASEWGMPSDSTWRQGVEAGGGLYIPNTMAQAKIWFDRTTDTPINQFVENKAYYNHCIQIYVDETGYLRIGVKKSTNTDNNDWSIYDNFQLYYVGSEPADLSTAIKTIEVADETVKVQGIYNLQGQKLAAPVKGINIINGKKVLVK